MMSEVEIRLLGAPRVYVGGAPLVTDTRKATALIAYLAVTGEAASRDRLSDLLWPDTGQKKSRAALRRTLSALSAAREDGWLVVGRDTVSLDPERVSTDTAEFRRLLSTSGDGDLERAVELYRDDFMSGFSLRDSAVFDDWQFFEGEELRRLLASALDRISLLEASRGLWEDATSHARRWLALDDLHEPAHRRLMEIHAWAGRRSAALKQYAACSETLEHELGVSPLEETTRLYEGIRRNEPPPVPSIPDLSESGRHRDIRPTPKRASTGHVTGLFGRERELDDLHRAFEGGARVIVLEGEPGVGKTRLAGEFASGVSSGGGTAISVPCYESEGNVAYGPFVRVLETIASDDSLRSRLGGLPERYVTEAARLLPELSDGSPSSAPDATGMRSRFFEGMSRVLSAVYPPDGRGVLFVDDIHHSDSSSLDLIANLSRRVDGLAILLTRRSDDSTPESRYGRFRSEVSREGRMVEIPVGRLDAGAVEEMVRAAGETSSGISRRIYEETEGVPLFVGEYLRAVSSGTLSDEETVWIAPGGVREVMLGRVTGVGESSRQVLTAAAVVGRSFDFDTVREASGRSEDEVVEAIEELTERALISEVRDPSGNGATYDFSHGLLRETVYERTSLARRRILHRRIAAYLTEANERRRDANTGPASIAHHYRLAGSDVEAALYFIRAGDESRLLYANAEALSHYRAALSLGHPERARLYEEIGDLQTLGGDYGAALDSYAAAEPGTTDRVRLARKRGDVHQRLGEWDRAGSYFQYAMDSLGSTGATAERAMVCVDLCLLARNRGDTVGAARYADRALELAESSGDPLSLARSHNTVAMVARNAGDHEKARRHLERSFESSEKAGDPAVEIASLNNLALALGEVGETERAISAASDALRLCEKLGDLHRAAALNNTLADLYHLLGREEDSRRHMRSAVEAFAEVGGQENLRPGIWQLVEW